MTLAFDPDVITELDVADPDIEAMRVYVECEECGEYDEAMNMVCHWDGTWLCPRDAVNHQAEFDEFMRERRGW